MVPQSWTDGVMPLKVSVDAKVTRVMVGRIELVTPAQRALLEKMAASPAADKDIAIAASAMARLHKDPGKAAAYARLAGGHGNVEDLGVPVPDVYLDYLSLGRFRTALLLDSKNAKLQELAAHFVP
jgi:hypothetical protein